VIPTDCYKLKPLQDACAIMSLARLLRFAPPPVEDPESAGSPVPRTSWPSDNSMLLGIRPDEFTAGVRRAIWALLGEARNLRTELERTRALLRTAEQAVDRDHLLPILNRRAFVRELDRQIAQASRYGTPASLAYIDLDHLKHANDTHGHACGDGLLAHFSSILLSGLRSSDIVARLGGDEFGVILLHAEEEQAQATCARVAEAVEATPFSWRGTTIPIRFTTGVVGLGDALGAEAAIEAADAAMYREKSLKR
jgi:diguanylate cyclase (GGDEF)-like protein